MDYKHTCDTVYTHLWGITDNIYSFGRPFLLLHLFTGLPPVHPYFKPSTTVFTRTNDGWTGLWIKLCSVKCDKLWNSYTIINHCKTHATDVLINKASMCSILRDTLCYYPNFLNTHTHTHTHSHTRTHTRTHLKNIPCLAVGIGPLHTHCCTLWGLKLPYATPSLLLYYTVLHASLLWNESE